LRLDGTNARTLALTAAAMVAFAANSLLCRLALDHHEIDAASFTSIRVGAGVVMLCLILIARSKRLALAPMNWRSVAALAGYMVFFSFAYISLHAGAGALILFGSVQLTMFTVALRGGERFPALSWAGLALAVGGLVYLISPGLTAPEPLGAVLMALAGMSWGAYSLIGRRASDPLAATAANFLFALPIVLAASLITLQDAHLSARGVGFAIASGAVASGCGYVVWYAALRGLTATRAAVVQLSVPVIAALGAAMFLAEPITLRLVLASLATIGGVAIVLAQRAKPVAVSSQSPSSV
jgi:drug/metabolite transporter (DMT)-like permease